MCTNVTTNLSNCIKYASKTACAICADGYFLKTGTTCVSYDIVDDTAASVRNLTTYTNKCAIFDIKKTSLTAFAYTCKTCHYDTNGTVNYIATSGPYCCPQG